VPEWIELLAGPILKGGYDYVAPMYSRFKYDGTITNNIAYPLTRALYGARIRQPIGGEFAVSGDLLQRYLELDTWDDLIARFGIDIWMTHSAINEGFAVCQARLGAKIHDAKDPASDLGPMFRQVVGTLFRLAGHYEDRWMRVKGSHPIPEYGFERVVAPEEISVNHAKLIDNLDAARLTHADTWREMLAPEQLERVMSLELPDRPEDFHFPTELWVRCLYDTLVAFHRPGVDRERLLAALTPLYFGRTAGFISTTLDQTTDQAERVIDAQARQFEELKPYLVSRWKEMRAESEGAV
jgi:glucosylglycerate synthase